MDRSLLAGKALSINVSTNTTVSPPSRGLLVNVSGGGICNVNVVMAEDGTTIVIPLASGQVHPLEVRSISNVDTTATTCIVFR